MALKNSAFVIGIVTWGLLTACSGDTDGTTALDTGSAKDGNTIMDGGAESDATTAQDTASADDGSTAIDGGSESVHILSAFFGLDNGVPGQAFGCGLFGLQDGMPIV